MLKKRLDEYYISKQIIGIYNDKDNVYSYWVGFIAAYSDNWIILGHIAPNGLYDGFLLLYMNDIYRIEVESKDINRVKSLYKLKKQKHLKYEFHSGNLTESILKYSSGNSSVVTIQLEGKDENDVKGFVKEVDEYSVLIRQLTKYGEIDGETLICLEDISFISCDAGDDSDIKLLHNNLNRDI